MSIEYVFREQSLDPRFHQHWAIARGCRTALAVAEETLSPTLTRDVMVACDIPLAIAAGQISRQDVEQWFAQRVVFKQEPSA